MPTPIPMEKLGLAVTMLIGAGITFANAALSQVLAPETSGKRLSEMGEDFGH